MNSIPQNFKEMLNNKIKILISPILYKLTDKIVDNIFVDNSNNQYLNFTLDIQKNVKELVKTCILATFNEIDIYYKNCAQRKSRYVINKSNVPRSIITIIGEITFTRTYYQNKFTKTKMFFIDTEFNLPKYDHYDPVVKGMAIANATKTSQAESSRATSSFIDGLNFFINDDITPIVSRQTVYNWIKKWNVPNVVPKQETTPKSLFVMADEKYIGAQDIEKDIMIKSFVTFEGIKKVSRNRNQLINRHSFSTYNSNAWPDFLTYISQVYDFSAIKNIYLMADGANWIKIGIHELKLEKCNKVQFFLCEFHFRQAINHITTDKEKRKELLKIFKEQKKKDFKLAVHNIIENDKKREEIIIKKLDYILNNYTSIKSMIKAKIGSSMESHISHLIASFYSSRPKGFSTQNIRKYLKLSDYRHNNINIFNLYMLSYKNTTDITIDTEQIEMYTNDNFSNGNIPILNNGNSTDYTYQALHSISH